MSPKPQDVVKKDAPPGGAAGFFSAINLQKAAFASLAAALVFGWFARGWISSALAGKADAAQAKTLEQKVDGIELEQKLMKGDIGHLHDEVREQREDLRAIFPALNTARPLAVETPTP